MGRVVHFEIDVENPERAAKFYKDAFGWEFSKWEGPIEYWLVMTGEQNEPGIDGGMFKVEGEKMGTVNTIDVESAKRAIEKIKAAGGKVVRDLQPVPGVGYFAYCSDTEGNVFGVMESDESAG